jgi:hypothetical protein
MDGELIFWILFFVGGYSLVVGYLLRIALREKEQAPGSPPE